MLCVTVAMQDSLIAEPTWQATQSTHVQMIYVLNGGGRLFMGIQPTPVMRVDLRPYPPATTIHQSGKL